MLAARLIELDNQRMVTTDANWRREPFEQSSAIMCYVRGATVHSTNRAHHATAEHAPDTLMSEADAQEWHTT